MDPANLPAGMTEAQYRAFKKAVKDEIVKDKQARED